MRWFHWITSCSWVLALYEGLDYSTSVGIWTFDVGGRGVGARQHIRAGEVVLRVPRQRCVTAWSWDARTSREELAKKVAPLGDWPRVEALPVHWSDAELAELCDTELADRARQQRDRRCELPPELSGALDAVSTRAFAIDVDRPRRLGLLTLLIPLAVFIPDDSLRLAALVAYNVFLLALIAFRPDAISFVPGADLFNHGSPANVRLRYDAFSDRVVVFTATAVAPGTQLVFDYGAPTAARFLLDFGFVPTESPTRSSRQVPPDVVRAWLNDLDAFEQDLRRQPPKSLVGQLRQDLATRYRCVLRAELGEEAA